MSSCLDMPSNPEGAVKASALQAVTSGKASAISYIANVGNVV